MKGFLDHLARLALGVDPASAARVSLPSRFAQPSFPIGNEQRAGESVAEESPSQRGRGTATPPQSPGIRLGRDGPASRIANPLAFMEGRDSQPDQSPLQAHGYAPEPRVDLDEAPPPAQARASGDAGNIERRPIADAPPPPANATAASPWPLRQATSIVSKPPPWRAATRAALLSDATTVGRPAAREERPVIEVTIERLDVRAPASAKPSTEQRRSLSRPTLSLSEYLRESAKGGRK
jgi:hypothetical protein